MAEKTVATPDIQQPTTTEHTRNHDRYVAPPVDIYETRDGLVVLADLPGVAKEALGDRGAACVAYDRFLNRWGALAASSSAREARARRNALHCRAPAR